MKYRKKPVIVEAFQFGVDDMPNWFLSDERVVWGNKEGKTPLTGKKITFKFNGKKYKAKTNAKGIAKITIKSKVLKKLKVGKKYTVKMSYLKYSIKRTVKVKR